MKHANKLFFLIFGAIIFLGACNKDNNDDWIREQARKDSIERARIDKVIAEQAPLLKAFVENPANNWNNPILDTASGIWYEILAPGDESSYTYKSNSNGLVAPSIEAKYKGQLLNGTVFDQTDESSPNKKTAKFNLSQVIIAWRFAFFPQKIDQQVIGGLTERGLKKDSKIRFITPSPWGYDTAARDKIPANSPLVFEIEVINISDSQ